MTEMPLTRYRASGFGAMVESEYGTWVRFADVQALLALVKADLDEALTLMHALPADLQIAADLQKEGRG